MFYGVLNEASTDKYYHITYEDMGVYEAYKKYATKGEWMDFLSSKAAKWLPNPVKLGKVTFNKSSKCYFTQFGYNKFKSDTLPVFEKVLDKNKIVTDVIDIDEDKIKYRDKYQIVI
jgi:hypothetical protein